MSVRAELEGHQFDLEALTRHFGTGDPRVVANDAAVCLQASALEGSIHNAK
jgi:hypothetical protein